MRCVKSFKTLPFSYFSKSTKASYYSISIFISFIQLTKFFSFTISLILFNKSSVNFYSLYSNLILLFILLLFGGSAHFIWRLQLQLEVADTCQISMLVDCLIVVIRVILLIYEIFEFLQPVFRALWQSSILPKPVTISLICSNQWRHWGIA